MNNINSKPLRAAELEEVYTSHTMELGLVIVLWIYLNSFMHVNFLSLACVWSLYISTLRGFHRYRLWVILLRVVCLLNFLIYEAQLRYSLSELADYCTFVSMVSLWLVDYGPILKLEVWFWFLYLFYGYYFMYNYLMVKHCYYRSVLC